MQDLQIIYCPVAEITVNPRNARTHSRRQIHQICDSIKTFGFTNPLLVDEDGVLIAGHGRLDAAKLLGLERVPAIVLAHLSSPEKRALMLADNKIALNTGWNLDLLAAEMADLSAMTTGFDLEVTGFEVGEIDLLLDDTPMSDTEPELAPEPDLAAPVITKRGDLWHLGPHSVVCGDARSARDVAFLMGDDRADCGFTDPPYNVPIAGHVSGKGEVRHREFAQASGEMTSCEFADFLSETLSLAAGYSRDGAVWFTCMDWRHMGEMIAAGTKAFDAQLNLCVWAKTNGGMGSLYRSQHELVFVWRKGRGRHRNNIRLGKFGRNRTNVWCYAGVNSFRDGRMDELRAHPTAKPVAMIKDALLDVTSRGDVVLDPFAGAGATLIAAERSGRSARLLEIDPAYVDTMLRRWREETGEDPIRAADGAQLSGLEGDIGLQGGDHDG
ncbi:site-specific DNA-methyltransferase [Aestuariivita boseongensis]|uniref:site-specific DNA-methyltransferase n=1 Tax=Aestuariivita boseongensis TaxID=1470562 RepID=UPI00067FAF80|nr:DNA methyltransferase [Aestuariivita boseongensis]